MRDYEADIAKAYEYLGYPNSYFESIYGEFAGGWDGVPCSEIACCISYKAGNLSKIYVSNYAEGLVNLYQQNRRFGYEPSLGAFIWFDYGNGPEHTGRVVGINGDYITTIEGNTNGGYVNEFTYHKNDSTIYGYGYPNYSDSGDIDIFGIDISKWNGDFNIQSAKDDYGVQFVIIKAGGSDDGIYIDSQFRNNYNKCKAAGVPCGLYWYTKAASVSALQNEINYLLYNISGMQFELPLYLDIEESVTYDYSDQLALAWINGMVDRHYYPGIYSGYYWYLDKLTDPLIGQYSVWLAFWTSQKPDDFIHHIDVWQYGEDGSIAGVTTDVDRMYTDYTFIQTQGWNGYTGTPTYTIRTTSPAGSGSPFYNTVSSGGYNTSIVGNGAVSGANVMNNCVGYSQGRMMEMYSEAISPITSAGENIFSMFNANAEDWVNIAIANGFPVGQVPAYGAVGVWYSASQNVGHVANVETYEDGTWKISEGHYNYPGGQGSWDYSYLQNNADFLPAFIGADSSWHLIGFIYPFTATPPGPGPGPGPGPTPTKKKNWFIYNLFVF